jgi:hypothetical protein
MLVPGCCRRVVVQPAIRHIQATHRQHTGSTQETCSEFKPTSWRSSACIHDVWRCNNSTRLGSTPCHAMMAPPHRTPHRSTPHLAAATPRWLAPRLVIYPCHATQARGPQQLLRHPPLQLGRLHRCLLHVRHVLCQQLLTAMTHRTCAWCHPRDKAPW